jgi:site-specific DNA-methyltransferase (adenine-specific)
MIDIHAGDNLTILPTFPDASFDLVYTDPPFNTGKNQRRVEMKTVRDATGDRVGFYGERYRTERLATRAYADSFDDYLAFIEPRLRHIHRLLKPTGALMLHLDYRESHYCKVLLDQIFGRECFMNEIIWSYDYGGRSRTRWPAKHDTIFWYVKDPEHYTFNYDAIDRIPYLAPTLVTPEKAARGKIPTDVWWHTIVSPGGKEKTGYPTQKPLGIINRIVAVHSNPDDRLLDCFAGSGTLGESAHRLGRHCTLIDNHPEALRTMQSRLAWTHPTLHPHHPSPQINDDGRG